MKVRALDSAGDWEFGKGKQNYKRDKDAIQQNIRTRLFSFLGDCFFSLESGIDWFNLIGGKSIDAISLPVRATILNTDGVTAIIDATVSLDAQRVLRLTYTVNTVYGQIVDDLVLPTEEVTLVSITITPNDPSVPLGLTQQFTAIGNYSNGSTANITGSVTWASATPSHATISSGGLMSTVALGTSVISATLGAISDDTTATVSAAELVSIEVTPAMPSTYLGLTQQFTATGTYTDSTTTDITGSVIWSSSNTAHATISGGGLMSTVGVGTTIISATDGAISGNTTATVAAAALVSIAVTPASPSIALGLTQQMTATGTYTDSSTVDITGSVTWASGTPSHATISIGGLVTTVATGTSVISATLGLISGNTTATVAPAALVSISVTPVNPSVFVDYPEQFYAEGTYTDSSTADITTSVTWTSGSTVVATISNTGGSEGLATILSAGSSLITATLGLISGNSTLSASVYVYPQDADIIINTTFAASLTSDVGPDPTFTRSLIRNYANSKTTLAQVATTVPAFNATIFGATDSLVSGIELTGETENLLYYSEDLTQAEWTAIAGGSISSNTAVDPFGTSLADTISGSTIGDGYEQITGYVTTNAGGPATPTKAYLYSVFLKCSTGTQLVYLQMRDTLDASLTQIQECRLTTTWQRFECYFVGTTTSTGFLACGIVVGNSNTCRVFGNQMQQAGNTGGSNMRARACAGPYVKTTNTTKFSNTEVLTYPSATVDNARAEGSVSFWVKTGRGGTIINEGNIMDYFSLGSEQFATLQTSEANTVFYMDSVAHNNVNGMGLRTGVWNHVVVTWKDSSNELSMIINGQIYYDAVAAFTTWTAGLDLYIGQHSGTPQYWSAFSVFRNFVMWQKKLTNAEAISIFSDQQPLFAETPGTGLLFEVDLGVSPAPTTFANQVVQYEGTLLPGSFSHTGTVLAQQPYFSDATTYAGLAPYGNPAYPAAPPLNTATNKGMQFECLNKNFILQSCAPATTWTSVGAPTLTNAVGNAFGANMPYGSIAGVATEGIKQSISLAVADGSFVVSAWVKVASGTLAGKIIVEGDSGGTPETATTSFTATTTWQHVFKYVDFTGSATGMASMKLLLDATGTLLVSGMQMEQRRAGQFCNIKAPGTFIKTTTATVEIQPNYLWYKTAGNINPLSGTMTVWAWLDCNSSDIANSDGPNLLSIVGDQGTHVFDLHYVDDIIHFSFAGPSPDIATYGPVGVVKNQWHQYGVSWSANETGTYDIRVYTDGVLRDTFTGVNGILPGWDRLVVGAGITAQLATDHWKGGIGKIQSYGEQDDAYVAADWTANRAGYGR